MRRIHALGIAIVIMFMGVAAGAAEAPALPNPFYAMDTGTDPERLSADQQAGMLKELGYAGIDMVYRDLDKIKTMEVAVDKQGIKLFSIFFMITLEKGKAPDLGKFTALCEALEGRDTVIMLALMGKNIKAGSNEVDGQAKELLRQASEIAEKHGLRVAVYPHTFFVVERVDHAVRLVKAVDRKNLGVVFNLCHYLRTDGTEVEARIRDAAPVTFAVTINGADKNEKGRALSSWWTRPAQTLDKGEYDVTGFVTSFIEQGYRGPIGLQHYGIKGDTRENLRRSMAAWKKISAEAARRAAAGSQH